MFSWLNFLTYAIITAATPGPNNLMSMSNAGRLGFKKALPFNIGIWCGFTLVTLLCALFCGALSGFIPKIKPFMLCVGAAYMLWLAYKTFKSAPELKAAQTGGGFINGLLLQFVNPKIYIYCVVSMEAYILPFYQNEPALLLLFALLLAFIGFAFTLCWALFGSAFRLLFSKYAKVTNTLMAILLVYCAVSLFF